jgi:hypothetical protein
MIMSVQVFRRVWLLVCCARVAGVAMLVASGVQGQEPLHAGLIHMYGYALRVPATARPYEYTPNTAGAGNNGARNS